MDATDVYLSYELRDEDCENYAPRAYKLIEKYYYLQPVGVILITFVLVSINVIFNFEEYAKGDVNFSWLHIIWMFPCPVVLITFYGMCLPYTWKNNTTISKRSYNRLFILVCSRGFNKDAVNRTWQSIKHLHNGKTRTSVIIITEEGALLDDIPFIHLMYIPKEFVCDRALYKARALEYFRINKKIQDDDWIYHLDEESIISQYEVKSALDFIENTTHDLGQGLILYNSYQFWEGAGLMGILCNVCDNIRVGDDLGRFHVQYTKLHTSYFGCHGSNLLLSGKVTNSITWDNNSLTEDFFFAVKASQQGFTCGHIQGFCREQSPTNLHDFMKQRRRWFLGIFRSSEIHARINIFFWIICSLTSILSIANIFINRRIHPIWVVVIFSFVYSSFVMVYITSTAIQCYDKRFSTHKMIICILVVIILQPVCGVIETICVLYAISCPVKSFDVIKK